MRGFLIGTLWTFEKVALTIKIVLISAILFIKSNYYLATGFLLYKEPLS
jgi:hypothetical protein